MPPHKALEVHQARSAPDALVIVAKLHPVTPVSLAMWPLLWCRSDSVPDYTETWLI